MNVYLHILERHVKECPQCALGAQGVPMIAASCRFGVGLLLQYIAAMIASREEHHELDS